MKGPLGTDYQGALCHGRNASTLSIALQEKLNASPPGPSGRTGEEALQ